MGGIIDPSSKYVTVSYGNNYDIGLLNFQDLSLIKTLPQYFASGFDFSSDGKYLATCGADGHLKIWDINNGFTLYKDLLYTRDSDLRHIKFSTDSKYLVSGGGGYCYTAIWSVSEGKLLKEYGINDLGGGSVGVYISNDMKYLYSSNEAIKKYKFNIPTGVSSEASVTSIFPNPTNGFVTISNICNLPQLQYSISNQSGQVLNSSFAQNTNNQIRLNFTSYPIGVYYIIIESEVYKVIKE